MVHYQTEISCINTVTFRKSDWCGITAEKIIGPFFYEDPETEAALTITTERYVALLEHVFQDEQNSETWFQHDDAPAHTS